MPQTHLFIALSLIVVSHAVAAQRMKPELVPSREIHIVIIDTAGTPLPGVTATALRESESEAQDWRLLKDEGRLKITDANGRVDFKSLLEGSYNIRLQLTGFLSETIGPIPIGKPCIRLPELRVVLAPWASTCF